MKGDTNMDERTRELISIGASVSAHCQPCLEYHLGKARELGADEADILEAIDLGYGMENGASTAMKKYVDRVLKQEAKPVGPCCPMSAGKAGCCG